MDRKTLKKMPEDNPSVAEEESIEEEEIDEQHEEYESAKKEADKALKNLKRTITRHEMNRYAEENGEGSGPVPAGA
jgi:hypothetical protein